MTSGCVCVYMCGHLSCFVLLEPKHPQWILSCLRCMWCERGLETKKWLTAPLWATLKRRLFRCCLDIKNIHLRQQSQRWTRHTDAFIFYTVYECLYLLITGPPVFQYIESNYGSSENKLAGLILVRHKGDHVYIQVFSLCVQCGCVWRYITCIIYNSALTVSHHLLGFWSLQTCYQVLFKCFGSLIHSCTELKRQPTLKWLLKQYYFMTWY